MGRFWLPTLFHAAGQDLKLASEILGEWIASADGDKIIASAMLLRGFVHSVVFALDDFIADLLDAAQAVGTECCDRASSELFGVSIGGVHSGTPGKPSPRHMTDKASALALVDKHQAREPARKFYQSLVDFAESSVQRELARWEEEGF